jgi:hypothetical protein
MADDEGRVAMVGDDPAEGPEPEGLLAEYAEQPGAGIGGERRPPRRSAKTDSGPRLEKARGLQLQSVMAVALPLEGVDRSDPEPSKESVQHASKSRNYV